MKKDCYDTDDHIPTREELRQVVQELVEEGVLIPFPERDPDTGEWRNRYVHRDFVKFH
jgi:hypothetical protein